MDVVLMLNSECNARCRHCYVSYSGRRDPAEALATVKKLRAAGHKVIVAGSETLLDPRYLEAYRAARQDYILTNGIILDKDKSLYRKLKKNGIRWIFFSLHFGIEKDLRSVPEKLVARAMKEAVRRGFGVTVETIVNPKNYACIGEMCRRADKYGASEIMFYRIVPIGRAANLYGHTLTPEQISAVFEQVVAERKKYKKSVLCIRFSGSFGPRLGPRSKALVKENRYCPIGRELVTIDPNNNVYGCPLCIRPEGVIGRYEDGKIIMTRDLFGGRRDTCIAHLF